MHPPFSVILLTTLIGVGQGLFLALYTGQVYAFFGLLPEQDSVRFYAAGGLLSLLLLGAGLFASFFHLGHPERAWRSAAMWRTSWLSREVILLPAFMAVVAAYALAHYFQWYPSIVSVGSGAAIDPTHVLGAIGTLLCFALFICTGMIYACMRFLQEWHTPLTVINYVLLGGASGFSLAAAYSAATAPQVTVFFAVWATIITACALAGRVATLVRNARLKPRSSLQTAIGVKHATIAQKSQGFMGGSFNTREFFHGKPVLFLRSVKWIFLLLSFPVPMLLLLSGVRSASVTLLALAFAVQYLGLLAERWFFFAQANHPQNLYYQVVS